MNIYVVCCQFLLYFQFLFVDTENQVNDTELQLASDTELQLTKVFQSIEEGLAGRWHVQFIQHLHKSLSSDWWIIDPVSWIIGPNALAWCAPCVITIRYNMYYDRTLCTLAGSVMPCTTYCRPIPMMGIYRGVV